MLKRILKNEKGFTLIELLAVIVILGIIAAIAVPTVGNVIDNSRRDAHIANARMILDAARMYMVNHSGQALTDNITLEELVDGGYINNPTVPGMNTGYNETGTFVDIDRPDGAENITYAVRLAVGTTVVIGNGANAVDIETVSRDEVNLPTS